MALDKEARTEGIMKGRNRGQIRGKILKVGTWNVRSRYVRKGNGTGGGI